MQFRVRGITDRFLFVALDETTEGLRNTCREALGVDTTLNFEHKLEFAKISKAWSSAKIAAETKEKIDAVHRARGEPVQMLEGDWVSLIRASKVKYGKNIHPSRLPAQSYFESYEEKLSNTTWRAEPLTHVVSLQEEERQKALRPELARSVGIHLDSSLSIQTQRRFMSSVPTTIEDLRTKYKVMANMFLLAQMRQPSRHLYRGLEVDTLSDFLDELLSDRNFLMESDDLWHVLADKEHRMQHWILKLTIANTRQDVSKVQKLEQRLAALEKQRKRSRSPRRQPQRPLPAQQALPAKRTGRNRKGSGKGKNNKSEIRPFRQIFRIPNAKKLFQENVCWKYQSNLCKDANCSRKHACVGCGKADTQYDSCGCLEAKI